MIPEEDFGDIYQVKTSIYTLIADKIILSLKGSAYSWAFSTPYENMKIYPKKQGKIRLLLIDYSHRIHVNSSAAPSRNF